MMKKITIFMLLVLGLSTQAQTFYFEDFSSEVVGSEPSTFIVLNEDTCSVNLSNLYPNEAWIVRDDQTSQGLAATAQSWTVPSCEVNDWLITPIIDLSTALALTDLTWKGKTNSGFPEDYDVLLSTTGTNPADFTDTLKKVIAETEPWTSHTVNLASFIGSNVYIAFRLHSFDADVLWIDDIEVASPPANELELVSVDLSEKLFPIGYLVNPMNFTTFCEADSIPVSLTIKNNGLDSVTTFDATFDNGSNSITETFNITALAKDSTTQVTFMNYANLDTFIGYFLNASISLALDSLNTNDTAITTFLTNGNIDTISLANPFTTSFEQWPNNPSDIPRAWWTAENGNNDEQEFQVALSNANASSGDFALVVLGDGSTSGAGGDDWAFSPCLYLDSAKGYAISYRSKVGLNGGVPIFETIDFHLCSDNNSASSVEMIGSIVTNDDAYVNLNTITFMPTTSGVYNLGLHKNTAGVSWWYWVDEFEIVELEAPTAPAVSNTWDACALSATLNFSYDPINTYTIDWGDGSATDTVTSGSPTHTYTVDSTYTATVTVTNHVGSDNATTMVDAVANPAPDATFTYVQSGTDPNVSFNADQNIPCYTDHWDFGDNSTISNSNSPNHTYVTSGTFVVLHTVQKGQTDETIYSKNVVVEIIGINEIEFKSLEIFPNPTSGNLFINFDLNSKQDVTVSFVSLDGKEVFENTNNNTSTVNTVINTTEFASGIYILNVTTNEGKFTRNIMVK